MSGIINSVWGHQTAFNGKVVNQIPVHYMNTSGSYVCRFINEHADGYGLFLMAASGNNKVMGADSYEGTTRHYLQGDGDYHHSGGAVSDERLKENIVDCEHGLTEILQLTPRRFNFIENPDIIKHGWIAQEVELVMSDMVRGDGSLPVDEGGKMSMSYDGMTAVLCKAIQELSAKNDALETENTALKTRMDALEARVTALEG